LRRSSVSAGSSRAPARFSLAEVTALETAHAAEIARFRARRQAAFDAERAAWGADGGRR